MSAESHIFSIKSKTPPSIELDAEAGAVYIRFKRAKVCKTIPQGCESMHIAVDFDSQGEVIGIEAVGMKSFSIQEVLQKARVRVPKMDFSRSQFSAANLAPQHQAA